MRFPSARRWLTSVVAATLPAAGLVTLAGTPASADTVSTVPASRVIYLAGHGWGHGHGLSQEGARGAASIGKSANQIVSFYYPGTTSGSIGNPTMRVKLEGVRDDRVVVLRPRGDDAKLVLDEVGTKYREVLPRSVAKWRVTAAKSNLLVWKRQGGDWVRWPDADTRWDGPLTLDAVDAASAAELRVLYPNDDERDYRGKLRFQQTGSQAMLTMAVMPMEDYLRGVVPRESPSSYPAAALQAQAIAARSYSAFARDAAGSRAYHICDSTQCQVFGGSRQVTPAGTVIDLEPAATDAAVKKTAGVVRMYDGAPIFAQYSASNGGWSTAGSRPYLVAQRDPWDALSGSPSHAWTARVPASALEKRWPSIGRLLKIRVDERDGNGDWGGRVLRAVLVGSQGSVTVTGQDVYAAYSWPTHATGMRSMWWQVLPPASDVTGDGTSDVVSGLPGRTVGGQPDAGAVALLRGSGGGVAPSGGSYLSQDSAGVPGGAEAGDGFGAATATGDFDGDGRADLAVGAPEENLGSARDAGTVTVFRGTKSGVGTNNVRVVSQSTAGVAGGPEDGDRFGAALAAGDVNGDGYADLVVGVPGEGLGTKAGAGGVVVVPGSADGLAPARSAWFDQGTKGVPGAAEAGDRLGAAVAVGDLTRDGRDELVVTAPGENAGGTPSGYLVALRGTKAGLSAGGAEFRTGESLDNRRLGQSVAIGDVNRNGFADVAVGGNGTKDSGGAVTVVQGSKELLGGARTIEQSTRCVPGANEDGDGFGDAVAVGDVDHDGFADVTVGAPGEDFRARGDGVVTVLFGSSGSLPCKRAPRLISQASNGIQGGAGSGDAFGASVAVLDVTGDRVGDLVVGAPGNDADRGSVNVVDGTEDGLTARGDQILTLAATGVGPSGGDRFGASLARD